jgi:hypothetical protein
VSNQRLLRRDGVYYYRRRVPAHLVKIIGKPVVQISLHTRSAPEARKLRTLRDLEWDATLEAANVPSSTDADTCMGSGPTPPTTPLEKQKLVELVRDYVQRHDQQAQERHTTSPPTTRQEQRDMTIEAEFEAQTLRARMSLSPPAIRTSRRTGPSSPGFPPITWPHRATPIRLS